MSIDAVFKEKLHEALKRDNGSKKITASRLGITETTLSNWLADRRKPMSDSLVSAIEAMGLFLASASESSEDGGEMDRKERLATISEKTTAESRITPITSAERELMWRINELRKELYTKNLELTEAKTLVKSLENQVSMLYNLLSGNRVSFICDNIGDSKTSASSK